MPMFMPRNFYSKSKQCKRCRWCGEWHETKAMYKLRDGPVDWYFCDDDHALEWLDYRHYNPVIHAMLKLPPSQRDLNGLSISEWVSRQVSHADVECGNNS